MIWSWSDERLGVGVGEAPGAADAEVDGAGDATGEPEAAGAAEALGLAAIEAAGVGVGVVPRGCPVRSDVGDVRMITVATTAESKRKIRPTR